MSDDRESAEKPWNYHDSPQAVAGIVIGAAVLGIVLAFALNGVGERHKVATNAPTSPAPVTAPPLVPEPPVGSKIEPKT